MIWETAGAYRIAVSETHRVSEDALLLAAFAAPGETERVCDLGTGCGIIPLQLCRQTALPREIVGVECQPEAVELFRATVRENGLARRLQIVQGDLRERDQLPPGPFDRVICNPPYFAAGRPCRDPQRRIARHEGVGCTLEQVAQAAAWLLRDGGTFCVCHRPERLCDLLETLRRAGLEPKRLQAVQTAAETPPWLMLCEARKGGHPGLAVLPPVISRTGGTT